MIHIKNNLYIINFLIILFPCLMTGQINNNNKLFFDALKVRNDLNFKSNKRILYTNIQKIDSFDQKYKKTNLTLNFIIRNKLHTAIFINQKKNYLKSMDGSIINFSNNLDAKQLTNHLIKTIGTMVYGSEEVKRLRKKISVP